MSSPVRVDFKKIYYQRRIAENETWKQNAQAILERFPNAEVIEVDQHWRIPELAEADPSQWIRTKNDVLVLGVKTTLSHQKNGRSADYIAASVSNGCLSSCQYCYVARRKGGSNPLSLYVNIEQIADAIEKHSVRLGAKLVPNQTDPSLWTYDIGCNADLSLDAMVCDHPQYLIQRFSEMKYAKATFATKTVNEDAWLRVDPKGHTRIRYSIMPASIARYVDIRTSPIEDRMRSVNRLIDAGYEVHLNFSPIIMYGGDQWRKDWLETFDQLNDILSPKAKEQLACEAFFLSHSEAVHELNMQWNPKGEEFLWAPEIQAPKTNKEDVLVYNWSLRRDALGWFENAVGKKLPYCPVRYSF